MRQYPEKRVPCVHAYRTHVRTVREKPDTGQFLNNSLKMRGLNKRNALTCQNLILRTCNNRNAQTKGPIWAHGESVTFSLDDTDCLTVYQPSKNRAPEPADTNGSEDQNSVPRYSCLAPCPNTYNAPHSHLARAPKSQEYKEKYTNEIENQLRR